MIIITSVLVFVIIKTINIQIENSAWVAAQTKNSVQSYEFYLSSYPDGKYLEEALVRSDSLSWKNAKTTNTISSYEEYIAKYPKGNYFSNAVLAKEVSTWENAKSINLISSFEEYLSIYSDGKYKNQATDSIHHLNKILLKNTNMIFVQGSTFQMGFQKGYTDERPIHSVSVNDFYIGKYEVTQKEWREAMGNNPSNMIGDNLPVNLVSWLDAVEFCNTKSDIDGLTRCYSESGNNITCNFNASGYRLPTEAEWEYAARGGNKSKNFRHSGSNSAGIVGWICSNSGYKIHPVGRKKANELGIYDMTGNVWEWCYDWYTGNWELMYSYYRDCFSQGTVSNPKGPNKGKDKVLRGSSCDEGDCRGTGAPYWRVTNRESNYRSCRGEFLSGARVSDDKLNFGFRIVRNVK